jgi:WhiB family redox-sensing transcriptional regulator
LVNLWAVPDPATAVLTWLTSDGRGEQLPSLLEVLRRPSWMELAACAGRPIELFFPSPGVSAKTMDRARAICAGCPVRTECRDYADSSGGEDIIGIWGGTDRERRRLRVVA